MEARLFFKGSPLEEITVSGTTGEWLELLTEIWNGMDSLDAPGVAKLEEVLSEHGVTW